MSCNTHTAELQQAFAVQSRIPQLLRQFLMSESYFFTMQIWVLEADTMGRINHGIVTPLAILCVLMFANVNVISARPENASSIEAGRPPHIVMILVDDWGWADVGFHRPKDQPSREVQTPNFDSLCEKGIELDQHYAYQFCSPSRCSLLSGRLPIHVNIINGDPTQCNLDDPVSGFSGIPRNMTSIAEKLRSAGYMTHHVGKWNAGMATPDHTPQGRGFMTSLGYFHHTNDYWTMQRTDDISHKIHQTPDCYGKNFTDLWLTDKPAFGLNGTGEYEEHLFGRYVVDIINQHAADKPLFLYYAPHIVHEPLELPEDYINKFNFIDEESRKLALATVNYLDDVIGNLTSALRNRGLWNDTLIVVSSDNGGPLSHQNNYPMKGGKFSNWQGGVRVNAFVSGGFVPTSMRGKKLDGYVALADWYATFCALAGVDPADEKAQAAKLPPVDGLNMWPMLSGQNMTSPRTEIPLSPGLISGDYKILVSNISFSVWTGPVFPNTTKHTNIHNVQDCGTSGCLFNIKEDPQEYHDLASSQPDILKRMQSRLGEWEKTAFNPDRGKVCNQACEAALRYGQYYGPFLP